MRNMTIPSSLSGYILSLTFLFAFLSGCGRDAPPPNVEPARPVKTITVGHQMNAVERTFPARLRSSGKVELSFSVSGRIVELPVKAGQAVSAGELLARLDARDYENALATAKAAYDAGQKDLALLKIGARTEDIAELEAKSASAAAQVRQAQAELDRARNLFNSGLISKNDLDRASTQRDVVGASLEGISQAVAKARAGARLEEIQAEESRLEGLLAKMEQAQSQLDDTSLKAPFDGVVAETNADLFQEAQARQKVMTLQDNRGFDVVLNVPESLVRRSDKNLVLKFLVSFSDRPDQSYEAEVKSYSTEADPQTQTYELTLSMTPPEGILLLPGMSAQVRVVGAETPAGETAPILIPVQAVAGGIDGGPFVWTVNMETMRAVRREVKVGIIAEDMINVLEGLAAGDTVIVAGVSQIREDMPVNFMNQ